MLRPKVVPLPHTSHFVAITLRRYQRELDRATRVADTGPMPRGRARSSSRNAIMAAALELFASRGYAATTIEDVRDASGASTGSIYHHFGSKLSLAAAIFVEGLAAYQKEVLDLLQRHPEAEAGVRALVRHYLDWMCANQSLARFLLASREPD